MNMDDILTEEDWGKIQNALHGRDSKWQAIGIQLNVSYAELTDIRERCGSGNLEACNREMQIVWLKSGKATWRALLEALQSASVGLLDDAKRIEENLFPCSKKYKCNDPSINDPSTTGLGVNSNEFPPPPAPTATSPEITVKLHRSLLVEHLEWLLKVGYTIEDIVKWTLGKQSQQTTGARGNDDDITCVSPKAKEQQEGHTTQPGSASAQERRKSDGSEVLSTPTQSSTPSSNLVPSASSSTPQRKSTRKRKKNIPWAMPNERSGRTGSSKQPRSKRARNIASSTPKVSANKADTPSLPQLASGSEAVDQRIVGNLKEKFLKVLENVGTHPEAEEFIDPVDKERAPDYYDDIEKPMCLSTMSTKVREGLYKTVAMFCEDFELIVDNCKQYNGAESEYTQEVQKLSVIFCDQIATYFDDDTVYSTPHTEKPTTSEWQVKRRQVHLNGRNSQLCHRAAVFDYCNGGREDGSDSDDILEISTDAEVNPTEELVYASDLFAMARDDSDVGSEDSDDLPSFVNLFTS